MIVMIITDSRGGDKGVHGRGNSTGSWIVRATLMTVADMVETVRTTPSWMSQAVHVEASQYPFPSSFTSAYFVPWAQLLLHCYHLPRYCANTHALRYGQTDRQMIRVDHPEERSTGTGIPGAEEMGERS